MRSPRSRTSSCLLFAGLVLHLALPVTAAVYTLSVIDFGKVVANLNAPEIESVTGRRPDSFFALTTQLWPTMPPGRWYLVGGTTELPVGLSAHLPVRYAGTSRVLNSLHITGGGAEVGGSVFCGV
mmetsp:Transcript_21236/g.52132  ORF Transcript_21236/g.52132 Transcript_21236/m.52132 type:complete len:125 (-) Transcript_21236:140-514(-)